MRYDNLTLREKILKTFIVTIREINTHGGAEKFFQQYPVGGMYYSEDKLLLNEDGKEIGTAMRHETLEECKRYSKQKLLVCADACSMRGQKVFLTKQMSLGSSQNPDDAYEMGKIIGMQMNDKGVDWVLCPSIDMCIDHQMYMEAISDDPQVISKIYRQVVRGIQDQGVCATVKHFPGMGTHFANMHLAPGSNVLPFDEWMETYGYTYKEMFKEDVMSVMTTHVSLKAYDNEFTNGYYPIATYSKKLTTELLKGELGFKGAVVTDALIMGGMATGDLVEETVQAFKAGADLLLWPPVEAAERIEELILKGEIPMSRLEDALKRIEKMEYFRDQALANHTYDTPDPAYADAKTLEIVKHGICQLRNEIGLLPIKQSKYKKILVVDGTETGGGSADLLCQELQSRGFQAEVKRDIYDVPSQVCWQSDIDALQNEYDLVIFNIDANFVAQWSVAHMIIWASHLFDKKKKLVVNYGSPYFAVDYFPEDPTIIEMNTNATVESVRMFVDGLLGEVEFTGKSRLNRRKTWSTPHIH